MMAMMVVMLMMMTVIAMMVVGVYWWVRSKTNLAISADYTNPPKQPLAAPNIQFIKKFSPSKKSEL